MKRRSVLTGAVAISASALCPKIQADSPQHAFRVAAGEDRFNQPIPVRAPADRGVVRSFLNWKVSAKDNGGAWSTIESHWKIKNGTPLHVHPRQDEWLYVLASEFVVQVGNERFRLKAGDSVFAPRQIPHAIAHVGDDEGKMLTVFQPAGDMEAFFLDQSKITVNPSPEEDQRFYRAHGMELVGPPLAL